MVFNCLIISNYSYENKNIFRETKKNIISGKIFHVDQKFASQREEILQKVVIWTKI